MVGRRTLQRALWGGTTIVLILAAARLLAIQGWIKPARIISGSMAERLVGEHFRTRCRECSFPFAFGVESLPVAERAVCPNCGSDRNRLQDAERLRGNRVLVDRGAYWFATPARFDVVALEHPQEPDRLVVKRVIGLPGERLAIRRGELLVNGQLVRKSLAQFRQLATVVHDERYRTLRIPALPPRWRPELDESGWREEEGGFAWRSGVPAGGADAGPTRDWLVYHHWRCYASQYPRTAEAPVADNAGYNQGESRVLQDVVDLVLGCRLKAHGVGELAVRVHDGRGWLQLAIEPAQRRARVGYGGREMAPLELPAGWDPGGGELEFGRVDGQFVVGWNGQEVARRVLDDGPPAGPAETTAIPVAIGVRDLEVTVTSLVLRRDVYYLDPGSAGVPWEWEQALPADHFLLLGDNPSLSEDSRHWGANGLPAARLRGKVLPLPW